MGTLDVVGDGLTISAWIRADDYGVYDARIVSKSTSEAANDHLWMLSTINGQRLRFRLQTDDGFGTSTLIGGPSMVPGQWYHVAATYDGSFMRLFLDGVEVGSLAKTGAVGADPTVPVWIGSNPGSPGQTFDGLIDEFRIHSKALTEAELIEVAETPL
jgi:hypothetical protein